MNNQGRLPVVFRLAANESVVGRDPEPIFRFIDRSFYLGQSLFTPVSNKNTESEEVCRIVIDTFAGFVHDFVQKRLVWFSYYDIALSLTLPLGAMVDLIRCKTGIERCILPFPITVHFKQPPEDKKYLFSAVNEITTGRFHMVSAQKQAHYLLDPPNAMQHSCSASEDILYSRENLPMIVTPFQLDTHAPVMIEKLDKGAKPLRPERVPVRFLLESKLSEPGEKGVHATYVSVRVYEKESGDRCHSIIYDTFRLVQPLVRPEDTLERICACLCQSTNTSKSPAWIVTNGVTIPVKWHTIPIFKLYQHFLYKDLWMYISIRWH